MVYILLAPGFEEMEALVPADLLRRAGLEVALTTVGPTMVPGAHHITVQSDLAVDQVQLKAGDKAIGNTVQIVDSASDPEDGTIRVVEF